MIRRASGDQCMHSIGYDIHLCNKVTCLYNNESTKTINPKNTYDQVKLQELSYFGWANTKLFHHHRHIQFVGQATRHGYTNLHVIVEISEEFHDFVWASDATEDTPEQWFPTFQI